MTVRLMSDGELLRLEVLGDLDRRRLITEAAMHLLRLERRQVFRLLKGCRTDGPTGLISKRRGRPSNRRKPEELRENALAIIRTQYWDFGPTLAAEKLRRGTPRWAAPARSARRLDLQSRLSFRVRPAAWQRQRHLYLVEHGAGPFGALEIRPLSPANRNLPVVGGPFAPRPMPHVTAVLPPTREDNHYKTHFHSADRLSALG